MADIQKAEMPKVKRVRKRRKIERFDVINICILMFLALLIIFPFYNAILISIVSEVEFIRRPFMLIPWEITLDSYRFIIFGGRGLLYGYRATLYVLFFGVPLNMFLTTCAAFVLSRKNFPGKGIFFFFIVVTMFFNGGLIPTYLTILHLGLNNSLWSVILLHGLNTFYLILCRNYMLSIPESMEESAKIDGANDIVILFRIMLPLCKPILATLVLFYAVDRWNEWFFSMLFIRSGNMMPLQVFLRNIVFVSLFEHRDAIMDDLTFFFGDGIRMAAIVVTMLPIMLFYPFVQKYFVKGIMVGAVKS